MTPEQFTFWLQGFLEIENPLELNATQTQIIKDHIALVFNKETPERQKAPRIKESPPVIIINQDTEPEKLPFKYMNDKDSVRINISTHQKDFFCLKDENGDVWADYNPINPINKPELTGKSALNC